MRRMVKGKRQHPPSIGIVFCHWLSPALQYPTQSTNSTTVTFSRRRRCSSIFLSFVLMQSHFSVLFSFLLFVPFILSQLPQSLPLPASRCIPPVLPRSAPNFDQTLHIQKTCTQNLEKNMLQRRADHSLSSFPLAARICTIARTYNVFMPPNVDEGQLTYRARVVAYSLSPNPCTACLPE